MKTGIDKQLSWTGISIGAVGISLLLNACGGGSNSSSSTDSDSDKQQTVVAGLQGTAAIGQAIVGATLTATCQDGSGFTTSPITTDNHGKWQGSVASNQLPCLLQLSAGTPAIELSSMAFAEGTVNISPLTQLVLAIATHDAESGWVPNKSEWPDQASVDSAAQALSATLKNKGYAPATLSGSPFTTTFDADGTGWDAVLDALRELVEDPAGTIAGYEALAQLLADGNLNALPDYESSGSGESPATPEAVGPADLGNDSAPAAAAFMTLMTASWPVAIYEVPESNPEWYGKGSLTISGSVDNWIMELRGADGNIISSLYAQGAFTSALRPFSELTLGGNTIYMPGQIFINKGTVIGEYLNAFVEWDSGLIEGSAGGNGEVKFRNSLLAYGASVPETLSDLAATWTATTNVYCNGPYSAPTTVTNSVTITAAGHITLDGKTQLCGGAFPQELSWGGNNDFLIPGPEDSDGVYLMHIDAQDTVNVSAGLLQIHLNQDMSVRNFKGWVAGELFELKNPVRQ